MTWARRCISQVCFDLLALLPRLSNSIFVQRLNSTLNLDCTCIMAIEFHSAPTAPLPPPEPEAKIDISKRYDVYCIEPNRHLVVYRNALFKGVVCLLPQGGRFAHSSEFVELEQSNGQSIFICRGGIFRICSPGTTVVAEIVTSDKQGG
jgi:hypothetical protein